jgi:hypothetical protein
MFSITLKLDKLFTLANFSGADEEKTRGIIVYFSDHIEGEYLSQSVWAFLISFKEQNNHGNT